MPITDRRNMLRVGLAFVALPSTVLHFGCAPNQDATSRNSEGSPDTESIANDNPPEKENTMRIQYLEFVTPDVDAVCATYSQVHGVTFSDSDPNLGGARTAKLADGGMLGVRAPMRDTEKPVVRPYILVKDIEAAVAAAGKSGAEIAIPPMEIEGHGTFAIFIQNGIESGLWQL